MGTQYYRINGSKLETHHVQGSYNGASDVAHLVLEMLNHEGEIHRPQLMRMLKKEKLIHRIPDTRLSAALNEVMGKLTRQRVVEALTLEQYVAGGNLTAIQIHNYRMWLRYAGLAETHRGGEKQGCYSQDELSIFRKTGEYVAMSVPPLNALRQSVNDALGENKLQQFNEWYQRWKTESCKRAIQTRNEIKPERILAGELSPRRIQHFDVCMTFYEDAEYRREPEGRLAHVHDAILEKLVRDYSRQYSFAKQYPLNLYFALPGTNPAQELRAGLDAKMQSAPPTKKFMDYETAIFGGVQDSLGKLIPRLKEYLEKGFDESNAYIAGLAGLKQQRHSIQGLEIVEARYKNRGKTIPSQNIAHEKNKIWKVRGWESRGIRLLIKQHSIQELLSMRFWEIQ